MNIVFCAEECTCNHDPDAHDDGFGCTATWCDCLAGWVFADDIEASGD